MTVLIDQVAPRVRDGLTPLQSGRIARIASWDLADVAARVRLHTGWSAETIKEAVREYLKFIMLVSLHPDRSYGMTEAVDQIWHQHILDTRDYIAICEAAVGGMIHHEQRPLHAPAEAFGELRDLTRNDLAETFLGPVSPLWPKDGGAHAWAKCCRHVTAESLPH